MVSFLAMVIVIDLLIMREHRKSITDECLRSGGRCSASVSGCGNTRLPFVTTMSSMFTVLESYSSKIKSFLSRVGLVGVDRYATPRLRAAPDNSSRL